MKALTRKLVLGLALFTFPACTLGPVTQNKTAIPEPEALKPTGAALASEGLYFRVLSNSAQAANAGELADRIYQEILSDVKLTESVRPYSLYPLYLYSTREEYLRKTGMPEWSGGVFDRGSIFLYNHEEAVRVLAHEISHLIFWEFFNGPRSDLLWINEGLAMHEEYKTSAQLESQMLTQAGPALASSYLPLAELISMRTALNHKEKEAQTFYLESWLLVRYLLTQGGSVGFYELLRNLKDGQPFNRALAYAFPAKWPTVDALEAAFRSEHRLGY